LDFNNKEVEQICRKEFYSTSSAKKSMLIDTLKNHAESNMDYILESIKSFTPPILMILEVLYY
jgi:hypothetical protein